MRTMRKNEMWLRKSGAVMFGASLVTLSTGCPLLEVEVEVREVRLTYADIAVEGVPAAAAGQVQQQFVFDDLAEIQELTDLDADLEFVRVDLRARSGIDGFDFVDHALVTIASGDPASSLPVLSVFDCADGACQALGGSLSMPAGEQDDALAYVESGSILVGIDISGALPTENWTFDADVFLKGHIALSIEP
jgi:hypothetical protein